MTDGSTYDTLRHPRAAGRAAGETHLAKSALCCRPSDELHTSASRVTGCGSTATLEAPPWDSLDRQVDLNAVDAASVGMFPGRALPATRWCYL